MERSLKRTLWQVLLAAAALSAQGCGLTEAKYIDYADTEASPTPIPTTVTYELNIKALVDKSCATSACHVAGKQAPDLSTFDTAKAGGERSQIRIAAGTMPPTGKLAAGDQALFKAWIDGGYLP